MITNKLIELLKITNLIPEGHYCDNCGDVFSSLEKEMELVLSNASLLQKDEVVAIIGNLPHNEDYLNYTRTIILQSPEFPYKEIWKIPLNDVSLDLRLSALYSDKIDNETCCYFSFAPNFSVISNDDFLESLKLLSGGSYILTRSDIDNWLFFVLVINRYEGSINLGKYDDLVASSCINSKYRLDKFAIDELLYELIEICDQSDLPKVSAYLNSLQEV